MATSTERQNRLRKRRAAIGLVQVTVWAPISGVAYIKEDAARMVADQLLTSERTGKPVSRRGRAPSKAGA
jgi:hypothetical protein